MCVERGRKKATPFKCWKHKLPASVWHIFVLAVSYWEQVLMCCVSVKLKSAALHIFQGGQITKHAQTAVLKARSDSKLLFWDRHSPLYCAVTNILWHTMAHWYISLGRWPSCKCKLTSKKFQVLLTEGASNFQISSPNTCSVMCLYYYPHHSLVIWFVDRKSSLLKFLNLISKCPFWSNVYILRDHSLSPEEYVPHDLIMEPRLNFLDALASPSSFPCGYVSYSQFQFSHLYIL